MKRCLFLASVLLGTTPFLLGASSAPRANRSASTAPKNSDINDPTGNVAMVGDAEIQSEIGISLADHLISSVHCQVSDHLIDVTGDVPTKRDKELVHTIAEAYADGRKVHDQVREVSSARK